MDFPLIARDDAGVTDGWTRAGQYVAARRVELGMTIADLASATGLSDRTIGSFERAEKDSYSRATRARLEQALGWAAGSIDRILRGGEPAPLVIHGHAGSGKSAMYAARRSDPAGTLEDVLLEIRAAHARLNRVEDQVDGLDRRLSAIEEQTPPGGDDSATFGQPGESGGNIREPAQEPSSVARRIRSAVTSGEAARARGAGRKGSDGRT